MTLKFGMQCHGLEYYQVCSNDDPGLTLTYFTARSNLVLYVFVWEEVKQCQLWFETSNRWPKWQEASVDIKTLSPGGCPLSRVYIHVLNHGKNCIKSDFKGIFFKLAVGKVIGPFCWHQNFVPWGLSILNNEKNVKIRLHQQQMNEVRRRFCWHHNFVPCGLSALLWSYIHVLNH